MDYKHILFIILWVIIILLIIHNSHKIISFVTENFDTKVSGNNGGTTSRTGSKKMDYTSGCPPDCPLSSIMSYFPNTSDRWGNDEGQCVKVLNDPGEQCARCPPGTFVNYNNTSEVCSICPANTYSDLNNSLECKKCKGASEGSTECTHVTPVSSNCNSKTSSQKNDDIMYNPALEMDDKVKEIYRGNIAKLKQNETLKYRIRRIENILDTAIE